MKGVIKVLKNGFGFIKSDESQSDVFFHANSLDGVEFNDLREGQTLEFTIGEGNNGKSQAENVKLVD